MVEFERKFPAVLDSLHQLPFDYAGGEGIDFEPYAEFMSSDENSRWIKAWTGNAELEGAEYRIFGQDGSGGYAAFWLIRASAPVLDQPIVFFGSEGEVGIIAKNFDDYLWLLAGNLGPLEAVAYPDFDRPPNATFLQFARENTGGVHKSPKQVLEQARSEFPSFVTDFKDQCR